MIKSQITIEEALRGEYCSICRLVREAEERLIWFILYEFTGDRQLRAQWDKSKGYCRYHNSLIKMTITHGRLVNGSSLARIYQTVLQNYLEDFQSMAKNNISKDKSNHVKCFFCREKEELEKSAIEQLTSFIQSENGKALYETSDGVCNAHFHLTKAKLNKLKSNTFQEFFVANHVNRLVILGKNLHGLQLKERYDIKQDTTLQERNSWNEVLWRFSSVDYDHLLIWEKGS